MSKLPFRVDLFFEGTRFAGNEQEVTKVTALVKTGRQSTNLNITRLLQTDISAILFKYYLNINMWYFILKVRTYLKTMEYIPGMSQNLEEAFTT